VTDRSRPARLRAFLARHGLQAAFAVALLLVCVGVTGVCTHNAFQWVGRVFPGFLLNERLAISTVGQYHWTGSQAGLRYPERVVAVDGTPVTTMHALMGIVEAAPEGTPFTYTVERKGEAFRVTVRSMRFTAMDLAMTYGVTALVALFYLGIGVTVIFLKFNTRVSWIFFFACVLLSLYSVTIFDVLSTHFGFIRLYLLADAFVPAATIHLALHFPRKASWLERHRALAVAPYVLAAASAAPMLYLYPDERFLAFWRPLLVYWIVGAGLLLAALLREIFRQTSVIARKRAQVVLLGAGVAFPIPAVAWLSQAVFGSFLGVPVESNYLTLPLLLFPASIAYAIIRHNLFDVDVYLKRALGYAIMVAVVALGYLALQSATTVLVSGPLSGTGAARAYPFLFAVLVVLLYNPVHRRVQSGVERLFFRARSDYKATVSGVGEALTSLLDMREINTRIVHAIRDEMFVDTAGVITVDRRAGTCTHFFVEERYGSLDGPRVREEVNDCHEPLLLLMERVRKLVTEYDVDENPAFSEFRATCGPRFTELGISLLIPLTALGAMTGVLALGYKKSGRFYTSDDVELLGTLANQAAVAIETARLAQEMKKEELVRTNLSRYLSPQVVDRVVKDDVRLNLGGDRKEVVVLFSDIRNFTALTENRPPEHLVQILNSYFTEMAEIIFAHNGSLDKFVGDAMVSVFGSLIPLENKAESAVAAAREMMRRMPVLNERWQADFGFRMEMGIGVNAGEVFLGNIGSPERMEFTVIGDTVNVASRLSGLARGGQILLTGRVAGWLGGSVPLAALPPARVKGKTEPIEVFEVALDGTGTQTSPGTGLPPSRRSVPGE
jgi:class 3 adenylate cyclase